MKIVFHLHQKKNKSLSEQSNITYAWLLYLFKGNKNLLRFRFLLLLVSAQNILCNMYQTR